MRRHTTKQPSGAATMASPRPNSRARSRKGCSTGEPPLRFDRPLCLPQPVAPAGRRPSSVDLPPQLERLFAPSHARLQTAAVLRARGAGQVVAVVVLVLVDAEGVRRLRSEQARILGMLGDGLRHAGAADMTVEA